MNKLQLDGNWELTHVKSNQVCNGQVPGFVQLDLAKAGIIPNESNTLFEPLIEWVEHDDWEYRRTFSLSEDMLKSDALEIVFEGIDTYADVSLNGVLLGRTELMFVAHRFAIKGIAKQDNELVVHISSPTAVLAEKERQFGETMKLWNGSSVRLQGRKAQYGYGWDWGPRLVTVGIHKSVYIEGYAQFNAEKLGYNLTHITKDQAIVQASVVVNSVKDAPTSAEIVYRILDGDKVCAEKRETKTLQYGQQKLHATLEIVDPKLWYPVGYGEQHLYKLETTITVESAQMTLERTVGVREVKIVQPYNEKGRRFIIEVNDIPMLCKGVNWIPLTLYPNLDTRDDYRREIESIVAGNMNMIRVWGGGVYENQSFFDECDRLGVMVWQDFMFACGDYPDDDAFCELVRQEVDFIITEYGYHPSIVLWCGNNENMGFIKNSRKNRTHGLGEKIYFDLMPEVCAQDSLRPFLPSSPYNLAFDHNNYEGTHGDQHYWHVWGRTEPYENYRNVEGGFLSEFGMQSYPSNKVMNKIDANASLHDPKFAAIQKAPNGIQRLMYYISGDYHMPVKREDYVYVSQLMQANALRMGVEHWISRMPDTSGVLVWQWSDLWPSISWSVVDFDKVHKASYFYMKRSFQSPTALLTVEVGKSTAEVYVVHDKGAFTGAYTIEFYSLDTDTVVETRSFDVQTEGYQSTHVGQIDVSGYDPASTVVYITLYDGDKQLARNSYLLCKPYDLKLKKATLVMTEEKCADGSIAYTITSDTFAKDVCIPDLSGSLSDNYFDLCANESKVIQIVKPSTDQTRIEPMCLNLVNWISY